MKRKLSLFVFDSDPRWRWKNVV